MLELQHPIQVVASLTGLSAHVIRVWEKRYQAVTPGRTGTNRRLYSDEEVKRLRLMAQATRAGHKIGIIARFDTAALETLVARLGEGAVYSEATPVGASGNGGSGIFLRDSHSGASMPQPSSEPPWTAGSHEPDLAPSMVREAVGAVRAFGAVDLQAVLERGSVRFGQNGVLHRLICPLAHALGDLWQKGELTAAHEHFASAQLRDFLTQSTRPYAVEERAPKVLVATPAGQLHEIGAVVVSALVSHLGWRVIYLGASLPAAELAGAALQNGVRAVCLSVVYPADDPRLSGEFVRLRRMLPPDIEIIVGGRAATGYEKALDEIGAWRPDSLDELAVRLRELRGAAV